MRGSKSARNTLFYCRRKTTYSKDVKIENYLACEGPVCRPDCTRGPPPPHVGSIICGTCSGCSGNCASYGTYSSQSGNHAACDICRCASSPVPAGQLPHVAEILEWLEQVMCVLCIPGSACEVGLAHATCACGLSQTHG